MFHDLIIMAYQASLKMSVAALNMVESQKSIWVDGRWRDLLCYTSHQDVVDDFLDARIAADQNILWCFQVFEEGGLLAGEATQCQEAVMRRMPIH